MTLLPRTPELRTRVVQVFMAVLIWNVPVAFAQTVPACGDANEDGTNTATDAAIALRTGVGAGSCPTCICDVNQSGAINATDGLLILQFGVGQPVPLACEACAAACTPKNLTGVWDFRIDELTDTCGEELDPPLITRVAIEEDQAGNIVITSPPLPRVFNITIQREICSAAVTFDARTDSPGAIRHYTGTLELGPDGDSFTGDLAWDLCDPGSCPICSGSDRWSATRR